MLDVRFSSKFKKDFKKVLKQGKDVEKLYSIIDILRNELKLPEKNKDHNLVGDWIGYRECHIESDWLLVYKINHKILELTLMRTGSHSELFA